MSNREFTDHQKVSIPASGQQKVSAPVSIDALTSADIARRIEAVSIERARLSIRSLLCLGLLGGLYIGFGGALATLVLTDNTLGFGLARLTAGVAFSLGLILLVVAGGELFTGNNLMVVAYAGGKASLWALLRNWVLVFAANAAGAVLVALAIYYSGVLQGGGVEANAIRIAEAKAQLGVGAAVLRGILCNALVCLAVWLSVAARSVEGKAIAIVFPISAFVALGFEHCIANLYLLPIGMLAGANIGFLDLARNIVPVAIGNTVGGAGLGLAYWFVHLRGDGAPLRQGQAVSVRFIWRAMRQAVRARMGWLSAHRQAPSAPLKQVAAQQRRVRVGVTSRDSAR